ncbi:MAG: SRPBCC family protein [Fibrobacterota bacterium]|nr:SRPBCC family protein [Fibrobacterota bacterium]
MNAIKYLFWTLCGLAAAAAFVWLAGVLLPAKHEASASIRIKATPEAVWAVLSAVENYPRWRSDVAVSERTNRGPDQVWTETDARGRLTSHVQGAGRPAEKWIDRIVGGKPERRVERVFFIVPNAQGGSQVVIKETIEINDPLGRFRARFIAGYAKDLRILLGELKSRLAG